MEAFLLNHVRRLEIIIVFIMLAVIFLPLRSAIAMNSYSLQVGAFAEGGSTGNQGVRIAIRTSNYTVPVNDSDVFWVGNNLVTTSSTSEDLGGFIQFGYQIEPGYYCLKGFETMGGQFTCTGQSENLGTSDARWFWQYWPNRNGLAFYYDMGEAGSVGANGTWHMYSIVPGTGGWKFLLDGLQVDALPFAPVISRDPAYFVAEKVTSIQPFSRLGPVEFRDFAYLYNNVWHPTKMLQTYVNCGINTPCGVIPYGIAVDGPGGYVIAGSGVTKPVNGNQLWSGAPIQYPVPGVSDRIHSGETGLTYQLYSKIGHANVT